MSTYPGSPGPAGVAPEAVPAGPGGSLPAGQLAGRVVTADGWPAPDAVITVIDPAGRQAGRARAGGDGAFAVTGLAPGAYTVAASAAGQAPAARTVVISPGRRTALGELMLPPAGRLALPGPGTWEIDPGHSSIRASAVRFGISTIHGQFTDFAGRITVASPPELSRVEVVIQAASLDSHFAYRDAHMTSPDILDVERFPVITYASDTVTAAGPGTWAVTGPLTLRDVTRPVTLQVTYRGCEPDLWGGVRAGFTARTELARDDFAITWNQAVLAGISAFGRTLKVDIDIEAVRSLPGPGQHTA